MNACKLRGSAATPGLRLSARFLVITLISIAEGKAAEQKDHEAEALLREALTVSHLNSMPVHAVDRHKCLSNQRAAAIIRLLPGKLHSVSPYSSCV